MPKLERYSLAWSPLHRAYGLYERQRNEALDIVPTSLVWLVWAGQVSSSPFMARTAPARHAKNAGHMTKRRTGLPMRESGEK